MENQVFIQRDSDDEFIVKVLDEENNKITLQKVGKLMTITLNLQDFKEKIHQEGSPWSIKD